METRRKCSAPCIYVAGGFCTLKPVNLYLDEDGDMCWSYVRDPVRFTAMMMKRMLKEQEGMQEALRLLGSIGGPDD